MLMAGAGAAAANLPLPEAHRGGVLSPEFATIPELLHDAGYATYVTGKWDLGDVAGYTPRARGFDRSFVRTGGSANHFPDIFLGRIFGYEEDDDELTPGDLPGDFYATRTYTDKMLGYLRSTDEGTPWFAYMPYTAPHWPLQLPEDWLDRYAGRYDEGYNVLREQRFQRATEAGGISDAFMTFMDILPTFMEIAGTEHPGAGPYRDDRQINAIVGRSAWPHFSGEASSVHSQTDSAGWGSNRGGGALIQGNYKVINESPPGGTETTPWRLYDLAADPGETRDLAADFPELVTGRVREWEANWR